TPQDPSSGWQSGCQSAASQGTHRRWELGGTGLKPPQPRQQLGGRQREVRHRCGSLEPTEEMNNCKGNEARGKTREKRKKTRRPEEKSGDQVQRDN
ncbi:hypothetical protein JOQ06_029787, partial [Pogonophryne albipinna]